jgi:two-component system phosphate regulon sensor histidine kinase PhoR
VTLQIILRQKKISQIKNDFINNMTHELKTPISTISLASQMLRDSSVSLSQSTVDHISGVIFDESKRLSNQVEKVLQMAVSNEGRLKLKFTQIDLNKLAEIVASSFEIRVSNKNGELKTDLQAENPIIRGDDVHITNVIFNLLDNAVKYTRSKPLIELSTENKNGWAIVQVKDNGIGIPKEHHAKIFERFYRVPTGNVHNVKGFGLGLSYVKRIVDVHNGKIKIDSTLGKGTRFRLYFPLNNIQDYGKEN